MDSMDSSAADSKDSIAARYWLQTVIEDRAECAPPPAPVEPEDDR
jgi:hypothetical protein